MKWIQCWLGSSTYWTDNRFWYIYIHWILKKILELQLELWQQANRKHPDVVTWKLWEHYVCMRGLAWTGAVFWYVFE